ncbi:MAG: ABC transporter ATP-binding protein [Planctomycetota bacterium]
MIWRQMSGQRLRYGAAIGALVVASCFMYLVPLVPQVVIDGVLSGEEASPSRFVRGVVELAGGREFLERHLWIAAVCVVALTAIVGLFTYLRGRWSAKASEEITRRVRDRLYDRLQHLPCSFHDRAETGDLVQRCTSDVETLRQFLVSQVVEIGRALFMGLVPIPLMLALDRRMTLVSVVVIPPIVLFSFFFFRKVRTLFLEVDEAEARLTSTLQENLTGIRVVRAFARQEHEKEKFAARNREHRELHNRLFELLAWYWSVSDLMCMGQYVLVVGLGGLWLAAGELQVGTFYFFLAAVNMFIWPIRMMGRILTELGKATVAIGRIGEILDHPLESEPSMEAGDPVSGGALGRRMEPAPAVGAEAPAFAGAITFDGVSFSHSTDTRVLDGVSFRVEAGQTLALLGPSGAGKSTIVNLLLRLYDPDSGTIAFDGQDISLADRKTIRREIAVVMQEPFLYSKTLRENISLGRSSAGEEEVAEAATVACVHGAILEFDDGYDTLVGERGVTLSGGQRQRVALARALLERPALLILDDALSAVDTDTESLILTALRRRQGRHTTLVIAHRLSTLIHADRILVLSQGRVVQQGTHRTLLAEEGLYRRLWRIQSAVEEGFREEMSVAARADTPAAARAVDRSPED